MDGQSNTFTLPVHMEFDGNYWVARCPALRLTAAHRLQRTAWMRAVRMCSAQLVYALNHDPALTGLMTDEHAAERNELLACRKAGTFNLRLQTNVGIQAEIPDMLACST